MARLKTTMNCYRQTEFSCNSAVTNGVIWVGVLCILVGRANAFDWRNVSSLSGAHSRNVVTAVQSSTNPPGCDATWAFAAASMLSDRLAVADYHRQNQRRPDPKGARLENTTAVLWTNVMISPQVLLNCATPDVGLVSQKHNACTDGSIEWALQMAQTRGVVDDTCMGYRAKAEPCDPVHVCVNCFGSCNSVPTYIVYNVSKYGRVPLANLDTEIATNGPIACKIRADPNLPSLDRPFHASIVGFDDDHTVIANPNFGTFNGNDTRSAGFFLLPRASLIECWWATPHIEGRGTIGGTADSLSPDRGQVTKKAIISPPRTVFTVSTSNALTVARGHAGAVSLPPQLDWRTVIHLTPVRSHHVGPIYCGACYSMATTSTFSDSLKLSRVRAGNVVAPDTVLAAQAVIDCVAPDRGCFGNNAGVVFKYIQGHGLPDTSCDPFVSAGFHSCTLDCLDCKVSDVTRSECTVANGTKYYADNVVGPIVGEAAMIAALQAGPIECMLLDSVPVFEDYTTGVICNAGNETGHNHDIEIVGYGEYENQKVWIGRNSWGTQWGMAGWFFLCRGKNNLGIESEGCYSVSAKL